MLALASYNRSICTRCALRLHIFSLQQRRQKIHTNLRDDERKLPDQSIRPGLIRRTGGAHPLRERLTETRRGRKGSGTKHWKDDDFREILWYRLKEVQREVAHAPLLQLLDEERNAGKQVDDFVKLWSTFKNVVFDSEGSRLPFSDQGGNSSLWADLKETYQTMGGIGLEDRIKYHFYGHVTASRFSEGELKNQTLTADLRYPSEWFPQTRTIQRKVHLHIGPTNSGKTYHALKKLEEANSGVYAGPLRLLAHEVYTRLNAKGKSCALVTGEERRLPDDGVHNDVEQNNKRTFELVACTVEMTPLAREMDVAVIDEIQMIGDSARGWAWTQAVLGVQAKELHLCGEARTLPMIRDLCASTGDSLEIHRYERLSPLQVSHQSLHGDLGKLKKGDCIVSFSVIGIHALRSQIEKRTNKKVAIVYGALPPETRAQQARFFNDPNNDYDYLVASDAVGMGLNLAIKRIIFETTSKFDGTERRMLGVADIKQIAGRAGRYRIAGQDTKAPAFQQDLAAAKGDARDAIGTAPPSSGSEGDVPTNIGLVTTLEPFDLPIITSAMQREPEPIRTAGIFPPAHVIERFASYFPSGTPFSYMLTRLYEICLTHSRFHLCALNEQIWIADLIEPIKALTVNDRIGICMAPASKSEIKLWVKLIPSYARCIADQSGGALFDIEELPLEVLELEPRANRMYLRQLEALHKGLVVYLWLSYRFAGVFSTRDLAMHVKGLVEEKIEWCLGQFSYSDEKRRRLAEQRKIQALQELSKAKEESEMANEVANAADGNENETDGDLAAEEKMAQLSSIEEHAEYEEPEVDDELDGQMSSSTQNQPPTLTNSGERFGGEEDVEFEEPEFDLLQENDTVQEQAEDP